MRPRIVEAALQALFPPDARCPGCGDLSGLSGDWLCESCRAAFAPRHERVREPNWPEYGIWEAFTAFRYRGAVRGAIHHFKFRCARELSEPLGDALAELYESVVIQRPDVLVPIPLHRARLRERGFNQSRLLADRLSARIGVPVEEALVRVRRTKQQARLSMGKREGNASGAFAAKRAFDGETAMLVDDILTSGSTANECARTLRAAGAGEVWLIAIANASGHYARENPDLRPSDADSERFD